MIDPKDQLPFDDAQDADKQDQRSQQDIHSNGLDEENIPQEDNGSTDADRLRQASDAAEGSFTLDTDK